MKKTDGNHKQRKFFTIMLIPESAARIRKLHVPYWALGALGIPLILLLIITALFQTRVINLENKLDQSAMRLHETIEEKDALRESLISFDIVDAAPPLEQSPLILHETDENKISDLLMRLDAVDGMKQGIISVFNELAALDTLPFLFDETNLSGGVIRAQGGGHSEGPEDILAELDTILSNEIVDMMALEALAEDLENYFRARPQGWPVESRRVGSEFGYRINPFSGRALENHEGIDINVPTGTEVLATAYGVVSFAGWNSGGFGYLVIIEHDFDYSTYYAHNSLVLVEEGEEVARGQLIALSGNTGRTTAPHCHYEVRNNGLPRNPREYLD